MDRLLVANLAVEGGGIIVFGRKEGDTWSFWQESPTWGLDDDDDEGVSTWASEPVTDLGAIMPEDWPIYQVREIHPQFLGWFRDHYQAARAKLSPDLAVTQSRRGHPRWLGLLGLEVGNPAHS